MTLKVQDLVDKIKKANVAYRTGEAIMSDQEYDLLLEELEVLDPENDLLHGVGFDVEEEDDRKQKLPITMASMNKVKSMDDILSWFSRKDISNSVELVLTPKYDGLSLCVHEQSASAWTRGNGVFGQRSDKHFELINTNILSGDIHTFGELIMPRSVFEQKYSKDFANPRNLVAGAMNSKEPTAILNDCNYIRYGLKGLQFNKKSKQLDYLNSTQRHKVPYEIVKVGDVSDDYFKNLFEKWSQEYEIDGVIVEVNDHEVRKSLGRETSTNNPAFARAYKGAFEEVKESEVIGVSWNISKQGYLKPTIHIKPIKLDGVTVSNITGNNARFMKEMGIGVGSIVKVKRSGMVIPLITEVVKEVEFKMPDVGVEIAWNDNGVELYTLEETEDQRLKQIISFFNILDVDNVSEGVCKQLFEAGYDTIEKILSMNQSDMMKLDRFGKRKSEIVYNSIHSKMNGVTLSKLQHASGLFSMLGSKKLLLLERFENKPSIEEVCKIEGFSEKSAKAYIEGLDKFVDFYNSIRDYVTVKLTEVQSVESNDLDGMAFVFSGVRRKKLNELIVSKGGRVASGVSKNTTHLVMKNKGTGTSKEKKALSLGQTILTVEELEELLK